MAKNIHSGQVIHYFTVGMTYAQCEDLYRHHVKFLIVSSSEGKRIQLPKTNLQKFISPVGLHGKFKLVIDHNNKLVSITRYDQ